MYIYTHTYIHTHTHTHTYIYVYVYICTWISGDALDQSCGQAGGGAAPERRQGSKPHRDSKLDLGTPPSLY